MPVQDAFQSIAFSAMRFAGFTANAVIFGLVPICVLVLRPAFASVPVDDWTEGRARLARRLEDLVQAALVASATATVIGLVLQATVLAGGRGDLTAELFSSIASTPFGRAYLIRLPLLAGLSVLLVHRVRQSSLSLHDERSPGTGWWAGWVAFGAILLATSSFSGHASVGKPRVLSIGNDVVHLLAASTWLAGIVVLAALVPQAWRKKDNEERLALMTPIVVRFSKVALVSITIVAVTGVVNSLFDVARLRDLVEESYGQALALKILLFFGVLALGAVNHFFVRRRLERREGVKPAVGILRRALAIELALGLLIMGVTGVLTGLQKTRESAAPSVSGSTL